MTPQTSPTAPEDRDRPHTTTVVVVGAGMAGLIAARELHRAGIDVLVLESAARPGGRVLTETTALGSRVDLGGQWIGHDHHRFAALATELGATTFAMRTPRRAGVVDGAAVVSAASPAAMAATAVLLAIDLVTRFGAPRVGRTRSLRSCLRYLPNRRARRLLEVVLSVATTADLDRCSVSDLLGMIHAQGGFAAMLSTAGGAQETLVADGAGTLAERLAADLGDRVILDSAVTAIHRDDHGATVVSTTGSYRAAKVIVTVAPPIAAGIEHRPALPGPRITLQDNTYMGSVYKAIAVYDRPFWRERGHAELLALTEPGLATFDTSPPGGPGHLCVLVAGPDARALDELDGDARRAAILAPLAAHLGPRVREPRGWHEKSWHRDQYVGGGYTALPIIGTIDDYLPVDTTPVGPVHWAGTETASEHPGYIEGALESGARAAAEVAAALR